MYSSISFPRALANSVLVPIFLKPAFSSTAFVSFNISADPQIIARSAVGSSGDLATRLGIPPLDPKADRAMICGSAAMLKDTKALLEKAGLNEGANNKPGEFVVERAFVD